MMNNSRRNGSQWTVQAPDGTEFPAFLQTLKQVMAVEGQLVSIDTKSRMSRVMHQGRCYYVKVYHRTGKGLRALWSRSRVRAEWENLELFRELRIPTATVLAFGESWSFGRFLGGAVVTRELPDTMDMEQYTREQPEILRDSRWLRHVCLQIASYTRRLHDAGFSHNDLNWRNILIQKGEIPRVFFIDCPSGRKWYWPLLRRKVMKDIAHLDKKGRERLSRTRRLAFYKMYRGIDRLQESDKAYIREVVAYGNRDRKNHWHRILPPALSSH